MLSVSTSQRRANIAKWIAANPYTITVYRKGRTPDDDDLSFTVTGRVSPAGTAGTFRPATGKESAGEALAQQYFSVLVTAWDAERIVSGDLLLTEHDDSGVQGHYSVSFARETPHKREIWLLEIQ